MAVVSADDLATYMSGIRMSESQKFAAEMILDGVQGELESHINRAIETVAVREGVLTDASGFATLKHTPVYKVNRVTAVSTLVPTSMPLGTITYEDMLAFEGQSYDFAPSSFSQGQIVPGGITIGLGGSYFVIEYEGGGGPLIAQYLNKIKLAVLRVAAREFQQMHDDTVSLRNTDALNPTDPVPVSRRGWMDDELKQFDRLRRRVVV